MDTTKFPSQINYLLGIDGGGSACRALLAKTDGQILSQGLAGPAGLALGIDAAWQAIQGAISQAFNNAGIRDWQASQCALGLGLAGGFVPAWRKLLIERNPGFALIKLENDGFAALLGAHDGKPGALIAIGTGVVGEAWYGGSDTRMVSGWGFPVGDEGSGAWLGLHAAQLAHRALDGRGPRGALASAVIARFGGDLGSASAWLSQGDQTAYASLAPLVFELALFDPAARTLLHRAGEEIATLASTLDPDKQLPLALCGGLAEPIRPWLPEGLRQRVQAPKAEAVFGALRLARGLLQ